MPTLHPHPCLVNPYPKSLLQPWLIANLREFTADATQISPDYPYALRRRGTEELHIPYFEFHGLGSPFNLDVGSGGDVYIDHTPGAYALWGNSSQGWKQWVDMGDTPEETLSNSWAIRHPFVDCSLWLSADPRNHTGSPTVCTISWFKDTPNGEIIARLRKWVEQEKIFETHVGVVETKSEETPRREAAAILARIQTLTDIKFPAFVVPSSTTLPWVAHNLKTESRTSQYNPGASKPDHPCIIAPFSRSLVQPHIRITQKVIFVPTVPPDYPFQLPPPFKGKYRIPYLQLSGLGPPTGLDVGTEGDIYLDLTRGLYGLYGRDTSGWKRWSDTGEVLRVGPWPEDNWIVRHPHLDNYALWVCMKKDKGRISWYRNTTSAKQGRTSAKKAGLTRPSLLKLQNEEIKFEEASDILAHVLDGKKPDTDQDAPSSLKRPTEPVESGSKTKKKKSQPTEVDAESISQFFMDF
ncbi:hypothetical protein C8R43DRAFT_1165221 [Mycena crocata]|nr:hypothetical protein C8R43DRAFT_1165221 [Mycena crocata]